MKNIASKTTKKGNTVYYTVDENGKKRQVSRETAQAIIASNNKEENTVASMTATAEDMEHIELNTAETDGSEEDMDDEEFTANVMPAEDDDSDDELVDPPVIKTDKKSTDSVEHKAQCTWVNPHNFKTVGNISDSALAASNSRLAAFRKAAPKKSRKKTTAAEQQQKWLENAKVDENGKYYIVPELTYKGMELNKGWNPCFYIVTNDLKIKRIGLKFAIELAKSDKAIEISKGGVKELKKAA